ncbi:MAG TPA: helix-turn-helix domain-containing protein [Acidimicrobiales bacterium]|jgi:AcrR family transcriptional regulator|nr:helix-turn-helix domain-containing protein [Acidimicrobiales bacterium]
MPGASTNRTSDARRPYDNSRRRQQAAETRERIVASGAALVRSSPVRDWRGLTVRAVAEHAGVNERTVYRHFEHERGLRDAVMHRLEEDAGIELTTMRLDDLASVTASILRQVAEFPIPTRPPLDPTLSDANQRQRRALLDAVAEHTSAWNDQQRGQVAAALDVLWSVAAYERLVVDWGFDHTRAVACLTWMIDMVTAQVRAGDPPPTHT